MTTLQTNRTENGLELRDRQVFCNVLIGKNKPWLLQIDLKALKPADGKFLALTAIEASAAANPPAAMAVIKWAKSLQPLIDLPEPVQQELAKSFRKWSGRWQKELAGEELPPVLNEVVQAKLAKAAQETLLERQPERQPTLYLKGGAPGLEQQQLYPKRSPCSGISPNQEQNRQQRSKGQRQEKSTPQNQRRGSDISNLLKQIESQFRDLHTELQTVKNQLKQTPSQPKQRDSAPYKDNNREIAKLREENVQLAETVRQLRETLSELAAEDFEEAISRKADTNAPVTDPLEQYKSLLTLRLREQIVNFQELNWEKHVDGLPLLLDNLLHTLQENGIDLTNIEAPSPPVKRRY